MKATLGCLDKKKKRARLPVYMYRLCAGYMEIEFIGMQYIPKIYI